MTTNYTDVNSSLKEFENLLRICKVAVNGLESLLSSYGASLQDHITLLNDLKEKDYQYRINLFSEYYNIDQAEIEALVKLPKTQRTEACAEKNVNRFFIRTLFDYNRYLDCYWLHNFLSHRMELKNSNLLDFGCLVSDYGFYFGMLNMNVTLCDLKEHVDFAAFRLSRANINIARFDAPADYMQMTKDLDVAVFGEVLEHLTDPYMLLKSCVENKVRVIFSSSYPYGDEKYFSLPGHTKEAKEQAPKCLELLRKNYCETNLMNRRNVWVIREEM